MQGWPQARAGQTVGLLGGSFDPAHAGHVHLTEQSLMRFQLDRLWWLVSPGNPLKSRGPAPLKRRIGEASALIRNPKVSVTGIEADLGTRYTAQTIQALIAHYPGVRFVWLMGADNLAQFHRWQNWRWIMETVPVGVLARPGSRISARTGMAARVYRQAQCGQAAASVLARQPAPAWCFLNMPMKSISSTALRLAQS